MYSLFHCLRQSNQGVPGVEKFRCSERMAVGTLAVETAWTWASPWFAAGSALSHAAHSQGRKGELIIPGNSPYHISDIFICHRYKHKSGLSFLYVWIEPRGYLSICFLVDQHWAMTYEIENVRVASVQKPTAQVGGLLQMDTRIPVSLTCSIELWMWYDESKGLLQFWVRNRLHKIPDNPKSSSDLRDLMLILFLPSP